MTAENERAARVEAVRERTIRRVTELTSVFDEIVAASDTANLDDEHDPEGATIGFERAQASALLARARTQLAELDAARQRLQAGTYGACESCGAKIPDARLEARPAVRICIACTSG